MTLPAEMVADTQKAWDRFREGVRPPSDAPATLQPSVELAREQDILSWFDDALRGAGVVGERNLGRLLFLATTSRLLSQPVSVAVKGPSAGGKSFTVEMVLKFFPPSAVYALSAMSERALAYSTEPLAHRMMVIYEAAGLSSDFASYLMRSLLSEGRIRYETVESTGKGLRPKLIEREGPTGLLVTTTQLRLHPENETRLLSVTVKDSHEQTKAVLRRLAEESTGGPDVAPWHQLQHFLEQGPRDVVISFAPQLAELVPPVGVRLRRDFGKILVLIQAHALLHRANRDVDGRGRIIATIGDYEAVRELVADLIAEELGATVSETIRATVQWVASLTHGGGDTTVAEVARGLQLDKSAAYRRVQAAISKGYLENREDRRGRPARLVVADALPEERQILPLPDELARVAGLQVHRRGTEGDSPK